MKPLYIYLTRHGQTLFNTLGQVQGWNDSPLTELGIYQAECTGYGLKDIPFVAAYSGPADRQKNTAQIMLEQNNYPVPAVQPREDLKEMGYGHFQGGKVMDMLASTFQKCGVEYGDTHSMGLMVTATEISMQLSEENPDVENHWACCKRVSDAIKDIASKQSEGGNVLVATSSVAIDNIIHTLFPGKDPRYLSQNCCIWLIRYQDGQFYLEKENDISYRQAGEQHFQAY